MPIFPRFVPTSIKYIFAQGHAYARRCAVVALKAAALLAISVHHPTLSHTYVSSAKNRLYGRSLTQIVLLIRPIYIHARREKYNHSAEAPAQTWYCTVAVRVVAALPKAWCSPCIPRLVQQYPRLVGSCAMRNPILVRTGTNCFTVSFWRSTCLAPNKSVREQRKHDLRSITPPSGIGKRGPIPRISLRAEALFRRTETRPGSSRGSVVATRGRRALRVRIGEAFHSGGIALGPSEGRKPERH